MCIARVMPHRLHRNRTVSHAAALYMYSHRQDDHIVESVTYLPCRWSFTRYPSKCLPSLVQTTPATPAILHTWLQPALPQSFRCLPPLAGKRIAHIPTRPVACCQTRSQKNASHLQQPLLHKSQPWVRCVALP